MLKAACCGYIGGSKSLYLLCRNSSVTDLFPKTKYINIVMYITMQFSTRVDMTEKKEIRNETLDGAV